MLDRNGFAMARCGVRRRMLLLVAGVLVFFAAAPSVASATLRVANHNDPAGDPTVMTYRITGGKLDANPIVVQLGDGMDSSYGPGAGTYVMQALPPAGWAVADIQCVGASQANFQIDIPNGRVTINHLDGAEDTCAFTNRRVSAAPTPAPGSGVAPAPPASELPKVSLPKRAALVRVRSGLRFASATVRITRSSVITAQLLWRRKGVNRVVGTARIVRRAAGTYVVRVNVTRAMRRAMRRAGLRRPSLTLKVVVVPRGGGTTQVFRFGVRVRL
jgi:hypothetical protein